MNDQSYIQALEETGNYRIIKRFQPVSCYNQDASHKADKKIGIFLDTETTGMNADTDKIIELAMVPFEFDSEGNIYKLLQGYNSFNDPKTAISEEITKITGITNAMVKGQVIDLEKVKALLNDAVLVIAHNAQFDRPFCEKLTEAFEGIAWGCSMQDIPWREEGIEGTKLEYLAYRYGFFYEGHRAEIDCQAGIEILSRQLPQSKESVLKTLLDNARRSTVRLWAENAPYDCKDILKARGYRWNAGDNSTRKSWYIDLPEEKLEAELNKLNNDIYQKKQTHLPMEYFNAKKRYSGRV